MFGYMTQMALILCGLLGGLWAYCWMTSWDDMLREVMATNRTLTTMCVGVYFVACALHKLETDATRRDMERTFGGPLPEAEGGRGRKRNTFSRKATSQRPS